ncbi:MAG: glucose-6-phosphate dehydrogenase [Desulfobacterales bacterium]
MEKAESKLAASAKAPVVDMKSSEHFRDQRIDPCIIVILGATGDLTTRKLLPALFSLYANGSLPDVFAILGCGRTELDDDAFRKQMADALEKKDAFDKKRWDSFAKTIIYQIIDYQDPLSYKPLADRIGKINEEYGTEGNRIFYFAIPPMLYKEVARNLGEAGLHKENRKARNWSRIVVEKPFGYDLDSAMDLDQSLHEHFREEQIFRIDHYLAKETVQNVLMFRFANTIFEPIWNRNYVDHVSITAAEKLGVEHRGGYYEKAGVLRDMFQNHMMQLLALTAMECPSVFEADRVRDEKVKTYWSLRPFPVSDLEENLVLGQYASGEIDGEKVPSYRSEEGVNTDSVTPTYAAMKIFLDNWRWQGIPFYLVSGKRLAEKKTEIAIQFKKVPHSMFRNILGETIIANRLILGTYPEEKIIMTFQTKSPGAQVDLRTVTMEFDYHQNYPGPLLEAYEKVLMDCMVGDQMLFWRQDGVELCWSFLTPIIQECDACVDDKRLLHFYKAGSWGPEAAADWLPFLKG